jgi:hypothetical protein
MHKSQCHRMCLWGACIVAVSLMVGCNGVDDESQVGAAPPTTVAASSGPVATTLPPVVKSAKIHYVIEAEAAVAIAGTMAVADDAEVGAGKYILIPRAPNKQDTSTGNLTFEIELPVDKDVRFWFRTKWGGSCSNSVELTVPGFTPKVIGEDGNYERWHWVKHKGPMLPLKAGTHKIVIAERESDSDLGIDQIVITTIKNFVPVEIEE